MGRGSEPQWLMVNMSRGRVAEGVDIREEDDTGAGARGGRWAPEPKECAPAL
jgi:hypothetical protein